MTSKTIRPASIPFSRTAALAIAAFIIALRDEAHIKPISLLYRGRMLQRKVSEGDFE